MKSSEYWEEAALRREIAIQDGATSTAEEILKLYDEALADIEDEIYRIKQNFQRRFGIDNETATFFLTQAQQDENLKSLIEALESAPNEQARRDILEYINRDGLSVRAYAARTERYEAVKQSIYARMKKLAVSETALLGTALRQVYKEGYYGVMDDTAKGLNFGINFAMLNDDAIDEAINVKWHGARFSERIWKNTDRLAVEAQKLVTKALMSGESLDKTARKLSEKFEVEKYNAVTLVRTETTHIHAMADLKAYEELEIEEYKYLATLDYVTCEKCQAHDGMIYKLSEAREGVNYPTMHPRCRCTTTMNMDYSKRGARNPITGKSELVDGNVTYSEWVKNMTPEQRSDLELSRKKDSSRTADKLQHEKYKKVLGTKEVPRGFKEFQELKYTNPDKWNELKSLYSSKIKLDKSAESGIINLTTANGINITGLSQHLKDRAKERTVSDEEMIDALINPIHTGNVKVDEHNRKSQRFIGKDATVNVNPDTGVITTTWRTGKSTKKRYGDETK